MSKTPEEQSFPTWGAAGCFHRSSTIFCFGTRALQVQRAPCPLLLQLLLSFIAACSSQISAQLPELLFVMGPYKHVEPCQRKSQACMEWTGLLWQGHYSAKRGSPVLHSPQSTPKVWGIAEDFSERVIIETFCLDRRRGSVLTKDLSTPEMYAFITSKWP